MKLIKLFVIFLISLSVGVSGAISKDTIAHSICNVFTFNSSICHNISNQHSQASAIVPRVESIAAIDSAQHEGDRAWGEAINNEYTNEFDSIAQFPNLPIPDIRLPGGRSVEDVLQGAIADQIIRALGDLIESEAPIASSANDIFPTVNELPGQPFDAASATPLVISQTSANKSSQDKHFVSSDLAQIPRRMQRNPSLNEPVAPIQEGAYPFNPTGNIAQVVSQLRTSRDGSVRLEPGDYSIPIKLYCMRQRASSPAGQRYFLAPLKGSKADVIAALNARASGSEVSYQSLQMLSWHIQAGMSYDDMPESSQALVNQFIPDYRDRLSRDFLEQIEVTYNQFSGVAGLPSFNAALDRLGTVGDVIQGYLQFRDTLIRYRDDYNALLRELIPSGTASAIGGAANTPWSMISDRVYARMITEGSAGGRGDLQIRVLPATNETDPRAVEVGITNIVADSQDDGVQPLTGSPEATEDEENCEEKIAKHDSLNRTLQNLERAQQQYEQLEARLLLQTIDLDTLVSGYNTLLSGLEESVNELSRIFQNLQIQDFPSETANQLELFRYFSNYDYDNLSRVPRSSSAFSTSLSDLINFSNRVCDQIPSVTDNLLVRELTNLLPDSLQQVVENPLTSLGIDQFFTERIESQLGGRTARIFGKISRTRSLLGAACLSFDLIDEFSNLGNLGQNNRLLLRVDQLRESIQQQAETILSSRNGITTSEQERRRTSEEIYWIINRELNNADVDVIEAAIRDGIPSPDIMLSALRELNAWKSELSTELEQLRSDPCLRGT